MHIALGSLQAPSGVGTSLIPYPYPRVSFTLTNGRQIADPANETPAAGDCLPYQCGVPADKAVLQWCSFNGQAGSLDGCSDPSCAPFLDMLPVCTLPQVPSSANSAAVSAIPALTPDNIVQPLPDITRVLEPQPVDQGCSDWEKINGAIAEHPYVALAILGAFAFAVFTYRKGGRAR